MSHDEDRAAASAMRSRRHVLRGLVSLMLAPAAAGVAEASASMASSSGKIDFRITRAGFILGFGSGSGTLHFRGQRYRLGIGGVSLGATIGVASVDFVGRARHLRQASDITGTYRAVSAGVAAAGGGSVARLRNSRGVELEISGKQIGFMASVDLSGMRIRIDR